MSKPSVKKNKDGTWSIVGVQENNTTQAQVDYQELVKSAELIPGTEGINAREIIINNPTISGGLLTSLVQNGAVPNNDLVKTLVDIDKQTQADRARDAFEEAQRISNERFANSNRGKIWTGLKGALRGTFTVLDLPFELLGTAVRSLRADIGAVASGDLNFFTRQPTDPTKTREDLGLTGGIDATLGQTKLYQTIKQLKDQGRIDMGTGFFPSEEMGVGYAARQKQMEMSKVRVKMDNGKTFDRPYGVFDPVVEFIPGIQPDTGVGTVVAAIGDVIAMVGTDPGLAYSRLKKTRDALERVERVSTGMKAATTARDRALLDAQLEELAKETQESIEAAKQFTGLKKVLADRDIRKALAKQLQVADEYDNMVWDTEAVARFLSGTESRSAINALANMDDWKDVYAIGKKRGQTGGFTVAQSKAIAAAKTREDVLAAIAPYIAGGEVVADVLETGTKVGNAARRIAQSSLVAGTTAKITNSVVGLAARGLAKKPFIEKIAKTVARAYNTDIPNGTLIHSSDKDTLIQAVYQYGRSTNLTEDTIGRLVDTIAMADDASEVGYTATATLFDEILKANLGKAGVNEELLREATRVFVNGNRKMANYWAQRHVEGAKLDYVLSGDKKVTISGPHLDSEYLNSTVYLPPVKEILDVLSFVNRYGGKKAEKVKEALDVATNSIWKRMVLVRPAYVIRNIAEEQIRVLGTGHISFFNNPMTAAAMWLGRSDSAKPWRRLAARFDPYRNTVMGTGFKLGKAEEEFAAEVLAHDAADSYIQYMADRAVSGMDNDVRIAVRYAGFAPVAFGHERWWEGLASEVRILSNSMAARAVARTAPGKEKATVDFLLRDGGKEDWMQFTKMQKPEIRDWLRTDEGAMNYLFTGKNDKGQLTSLRARIDEAAGKGGEASQAIKNLIAFGRFDGEGLKILVPKGAAGANNSIRNAKSVEQSGKALKDVNQEFADVLRNAFDGKGDWDGMLMNVPQVSFGRSARGDKGMVASFVDSFFDIAVKFEKQTTMGPEWRQKYWDAIYDISGALDEDAVSRLRIVAQESLTPLKNWKGKPIGNQHKVWKAFEQTKAEGNVTLQQAHEYAARVASKHVKELFYDASRKRLLFHQLRIVLPFGQAWEDTIRAWGRIALNNPIEAYKITRALDWLTSPQSSALYQLTDAKDYYDPNQGFFFTDPMDGQRKFFVPFMSTGMNFLANLVSGQGATARGPYAMSATPQSFNFAFASGSIIPGVGPGVSMTLGILDSYFPQLNPLKHLSPGLREWAYKIIYPFGEPDFRQGFLEAFIPGNWRRILAPVMPEQSYAAAFGPTMNYLASGGNYNLDDPTQQERLLTDTHQFAQWFTVMRGLFGTVSPFPLQPTAITTLEDGNTVLNTALYNDFKQLEVAAGGDRNKAYNDFFNLYSPNMVFAILNTSTGAPTNLFTYEMIKDDPSVVDQYPDIYGYAYPGGGYSAELYRWQQRMGSKTKFTPEELMQRATALRYYAAKDTLLARSVGEEWDSETFADANSSLRESFASLGLSQKFDTYRSVRVKEQLNRMALDDRFDDSDAVQGLRDYLYFRQQAVQASGSTTDNLDTKSALPQREWLAGKALEILKRNPDFQNLFYAFFKEELEENG